MKLYIKNMACESCKVVVKEELEAVGAHPVKVELGEAEVKQALSEKKQKEFASAIKKAGLELVQSKEGILADKIKAAIGDYIAHKKSIRVNMSDYLGRRLKMDYSYLSAYFSAMQASTVEQYAISLRIEKVKELLVLEGLTLTEIAKKLDYSSVSHLSKQFRQVTGLAASHFKKLRMVRNTIQSL